MSEMEQLKEETEKQYMLQRLKELNELVERRMIMTHINESSL